METEFLEGDRIAFIVSLVSLQNSQVPAQL